MRGTPWIRTLLLAIGLLAVGIGLDRLIRPRPPALALTPPPTTGTVVENLPATRFELRLSAPATEISIDPGTGPTPLASTAPITGRIAIDPRNPSIALIVRWRDAPAPGEFRFARIVLMPPGRPTLTHVFEAAGDIDDFIELPLP